MEKLIEKYQAKHEKVLNAYQTKKDLTEDDRMYLRDKMRNLLEVIEDLKSVGKNADTGEKQCNLPIVRQQSELLLAYHKFYLKWRGSVTDSRAEYCVDAFLANNCD
jgi:hypothetical protein